MRCLYLIAIFSVAIAYHQHLIIIIPAGDVTCFYKQVYQNEVIVVDFNVVGSTYGGMYINFHLLDEDGEEIVTDFNMPENEHKIVAATEGIYKFCFDNGVSAYSTKTVAFDLVIENEKVDIEATGNTTGPFAYDMQARIVSDYILRLESRVHTIQRLQDHYSVREVRDMRLALELRDKVTAWSILLILLITSVGLSQVILLKNLFSNKNDKDRYKLRRRGDLQDKQFFKQFRDYFFEYLTSWRSRIVPLRYGQVAEPNVDIVNNIYAK